MFENLGPALLLLRKRREMRQRQVAALANITRPMLSSYETGKTVPSLDVLARLLLALDATLGDLQNCLLAVSEATHPAKARGELRPRIAAALATLGIYDETEEELQFQQAVTSVVRWMVQARSDLLTSDKDSEEPS